MYIVTNKKDPEEYLAGICQRGVAQGIATWSSFIKKAKTFSSEEEAKKYISVCDVFWIEKYCNVQYIHPLNIAR